MNVTATQIKEIISADVDPEIDVASLEEAVPLTEQGIDSLDMYTLFLSVEEKLGVAIPDDDIEKLNTIDDIVKYVVQN